MGRVNVVQKVARGRAANGCTSPTSTTSQKEFNEAQIARYNKRKARATDTSPRNMKGARQWVQENPTHHVEDVD